MILHPLKTWEKGTRGEEGHTWDPNPESRILCSGKWANHKGRRPGSGGLP